MTRDEAHHLLNDVRAGQNVPTGLINRALIATGDIEPLHPQSMKAKLIVSAAQTVIAHRDVGRYVDPETVAWAEFTIRANTREVQQ